MLVREPADALVDLDVDRDGRALGECTDGVAEPVVGQDGGVDALCELAEFPQRCLELALVLVEQLFGRGVDVAAEELEPHAECEDVAGRRRGGRAPAVGVPRRPRGRCGRDSRSSTSWARSSAWRRAFSSASRGGACRLEERGLVDEVELVDDDGEPVADVGRVAALAGRQVQRLALLVDPRPAVREPEPDLQRWVSDGTGERLANLSRLHVVELDDEIAHVRARPLDEEQP